MSTITFQVGHPPKAALTPISGRSLPAPRKRRADFVPNWATLASLFIFWWLVLLAYAAPYIATVHLEATWLFGSWYR